MSARNSAYSAIDGEISMTEPKRYVRNMRGYGANPPKANWPGGAHVAVSFVVNYEEGGENCVLHGDAASEAFLSEIVGAAPWPAKRHCRPASACSGPSLRSPCSAGSMTGCGWPR